MTKPDPTKTPEAPSTPTGRPDRYPTLFALMREHGSTPCACSWLAAGFRIEGYRYGELIDPSKGTVGGNRLILEEKGWTYREMQWPSPEISAAMMAAFQEDLRRPGMGTGIEPYRLVP